MTLQELIARLQQIQRNSHAPDVTEVRVLDQSGHLVAVHDVLLLCDVAVGQRKPTDLVTVVLAHD